MLKALGTFMIFYFLQSPGIGYELQPVHLKIRLIPYQQQVRPDEVIRFNLSIKCTNGKQPRSIILPNSKGCGLKMIYLSIYTEDENNHYTPLARDCVACYSSQTPTKTTSGRPFSPAAQPYCLHISEHGPKLHEKT